VSAARVPAGKAGLKPGDNQAAALAGSWPEPAERAQLLLAWLLTQDIEGYEKSIKLSERSLLDRRFLVGIAAKRLPQTRLTDICRKLDIPQEFIEQLPDALATADTLHFGFEQGGDAAIFKLYFEYVHRLAPARKRGDESFVLHRAFKWDATHTTRCAVASYRCFPGLTHEQALARIAGFYPGQCEPPVLSLVRTLASLAAVRSHEPAMYLEVSETDNPRASFDLNFHAAGLTLATVERQVAAQAHRHSIPDQLFQPLWQGIATKTLGHLAGGTSRSGQEFLTIYYDPRD